MRAASDMLAALDRVQDFLLKDVPERQEMAGEPGVNIVRQGVRGWEQRSLSAASLGF